MSDPFAVSPRVAAALGAGRPVVALETTLVTHGFPHPHGLEIAAELEAAVAREGAVPATVGVLAGQLRVGLEPDDLERLAGDREAPKLNLSNLAAGIASGRPGSTTVAATLFAAHRAGIRVLATGGIGGVHRDAATTGDVSSDLAALARFPVAVVCAGAKSILDLPRTLEALESLGVPVFGLATDRFPAFYRRDSGLPVDRAFPSVDALAKAVATHFELGLGTGLVVANPIPTEHELPEDQLGPALDQALREAADQGLRGRQLTPYLLARLDAATGGRTTRANRALLLANATAAARLAGALREGG